MRVSRVVILFIFLLFSVTVFNTRVTYAEEGGDCGKVIKDMRALSLTAFSEFPKLKDIQQNMLLILYARERKTCPRDIVEFTTATHKFLADFESVYAEAASTNASSYAIGAEEVVALKEDTVSLATLEKGLGMVETEDIADSAHEVLIEFLRLKGEDYVRMAENTPVTREKIGYYTRASILYDAGGEALSSTNAEIMADSLERVYTEDLQEADDLYSKGSSDYKRGIELLSGSIFSKVDAYVLSRSALINFQGADQHYRYHREGEKLMMAEENISSAKETMRELRNEIALYFSVASLLLITLSSFLIHRLKEWSQDSTDSSLGNELIAVGEHEI